MNNVILIEPTRHELDVSSASEHGRLVYLFQGKKPPVRSPKFLERCDERLSEIGFSPSRDSLVLAGSTPALVKLLCHLTALYGSVITLAYDPPTDKYAPMEVGRVTTC